VREKLCRPRGNRIVFSRYPALRLRLRAGLSCPRPLGAVFCAVVSPSQPKPWFLHSLWSAALPTTASWRHTGRSSTLASAQLRRFDKSIRRWILPPAGSLARFRERERVVAWFRAVRAARPARLLFGRRLFLLPAFLGLASRRRVGCS